MVARKITARPADTLAARICPSWRPPGACAQCKWQSRRRQMSTTASIRSVYDGPYELLFADDYYCITAQKIGAGWSGKGILESMQNPIWKGVGGRRGIPCQMNSSHCSEIRGRSHSLHALRRFAPGTLACSCRGINVLFLMARSSRGASTLSNEARPLPD